MGQARTTIFIIDDDPSVRQSLSRLLVSAGFVTENFAGVDEFISGVTPNTRGCVVADVHMLGGNGLMVKRRLREKGSSLPVILLTADTNDTLREEAKRSGVTAFFRKPVDDQALIDSIEWAMKKVG